MATKAPPTGLPEMSVTVPRSRAAVCAVRAVVAVGWSGVVVGCWAWALTAPKSSSGKQAAEQEMAFMCENVLEWNSRAGAVSRGAKRFHLRQRYGAPAVSAPPYPSHRPVPATKYPLVVMPADKKCLFRLTKKTVVVGMFDKCRIFAPIPRNNLIEKHAALSISRRNHRLIPWKT